MMSRRVRGIDTSPRRPTSSVFGGGDHAFDDRQNLRFFLVEVLVESRRKLLQQRGQRRAGVRGGCVLPLGQRCRGVLEQHRKALMLAVHAGEEIGVEPGPRRQPRPQQFVLAHVVVMEHVEDFADMPGDGAGPGDVTARYRSDEFGQQSAFAAEHAVHDHHIAGVAQLLRGGRGVHGVPGRRVDGLLGVPAAELGEDALARQLGVLVLRGRVPARCVTSSSSVSPVMTVPDGPQVRLRLMAMLLLVAVRVVPISVRIIDEFSQ